MRTRRSLTWLLIHALAVVAGCAEKPKPLPTRHHVRGVIRYNGQPLEGATVTLWRIPLAVTDWKAVKPMAIVGADGVFEPSSYDDKDGAVEGEYALTVIWRPSRAAPDLLQGKYGDPHHPAAKIKIAAGENVLPDIELHGPAVSGTNGRPDSGI